MMKVCSLQMSDEQEKRIDKASWRNFYSVVLHRPIEFVSKGSKDKLELNNTSLFIIEPKRTFLKASSILYTSKLMIFIP